MNGNDKIDPNQPTYKLIPFRRKRYKTPTYSFACSSTTGKVGLQKYFKDIYVYKHTLTTYDDELKDENFEQHKNTSPTTKDNTNDDEQHEKYSNTI